MFSLMYNERQHSLAAAHVDMRTALAISTSWIFFAKPYGGRWPSGAPPG